jgi:serine protease Do
MKRNVKTPTSIYAIIAAGFALGAFSTAAIVGGGAGVDKAFASPTVAQGTPRLVSEISTESITELKNLDKSFANLAEYAGPAVVDIKAVQSRQQGANGARVPVAEGEGSGFIFRKDGYILTNDHVVADADKVTVILRDGREFEGKVTRANEMDLAVIKIEADNLPTLAFADSTEVRPGEFAMALGAPFGLENSVTVGHISALHRAERVIEDRIYADLIQTDTSINRGNSGGPLINVDGQVIGINTAIFSPTGTSAGIGFAIPSNQAQFIAETLIRDGKITRAYMGVSPETIKEYRKNELKIEGGAVANFVQSDSPASAAGLKKNDIITSINGKTVKSSADLRNSMLVNRPGSTVKVEYLRDGKKGEANVKLENPPKDAAPARNNSPRGLQLPPGMQLPPGFNFDDVRPRTPSFPDLNSPDEDTPMPNDGKPRLGVQVATPTDEMRKQFSIPSSVKGAVVASVVPGSLAAKVGMRTGDVITQFGSTSIATSDALVKAISGMKKGQTEKITFVRYSDGNRASVTATVTF